MESQETKKSWFRRNWMWVVPTGGCLTIIILFIVFLGSVIFGVSTLITESSPYQDALDKVNKNEQVISILGEPIETSGIPQGQISLNNGDGTVNLSIPIEGPNGEATLHIEGEKRDATWDYQDIHVIIDDSGQEINLLETTEVPLNDLQ